MDQQIHDSFLLQCKYAYFKGEIPTDTLGKLNNNCPLLISIAKKYFDNNRCDEFAQYFQEYQYFIELWAAHLLIEFGEPSEELKRQSIDIIKKYCDNALAPEAAENEKKWLSNYFKMHS